MQKVERQFPESFDVDLAVWRVTSGKLSLEQTGRLMRSLIAAQTCKRPTREQRLLLALYTEGADQ